MAELPDAIVHTIKFAESYYQQKQTITGKKLAAHCLTVAKQAELIGAKLYQDVRKDCLSDSSRDSIAAITQTAILHDVLRVSDCTFEKIAENTTVQVAAMVAAISRDFRLVETKRDMELRGRVSQSPVGAQIVLLADILCTAKEISTYLDTAGLAGLPKVKKTLTQFDGDLLAIQAASRYYMLRLYVHAARNLLSTISQKIKQLKQQAREARSLENTAKRIQARREREQAAEPKPAKKQLRGTTSERKPRYARKRTPKPDSD